MRPYSNSNQNSGRPSGNGNGNRQSSGNKPGYDRPSGYSNRENRGGRSENRSDREHRGSGNSGNSSSRSHGFRPDRNNSYRDRNQSESRGNAYRPVDRDRNSSAPRGPRSSWVEVTGKGTEEAIQEALRRYNVSRNDLNIEVLEEGSKGFLGIGSKPAKVKVALKSNAVMPFAESVLARLLGAMGLPDKVKSQKDSDGNPVLNILGPSSGTLIGRHGHTLESLQYLVSKVVQRVTGDDHVIIVVDVENYLERQKEKLKELAQNLAQKARETGSEIPMRPMSSKDRRVVHLTLKEDEHVTTESRGEGLRRRVVIIPKVKAVVAAPSGSSDASAQMEGPSDNGNSSEAPLPYSPESIATVSEDAQPEVSMNVAPPPVVHDEEEDTFGNR